MNVYIKKAIDVCSQILYQILNSQLDVKLHQISDLSSVQTAVFRYLNKSYYALQNCNFLTDIYFQFSL